MMLLTAVALILFLLAAYNFILALAGLAKPRPTPPSPPRHTFAVLVPAHNEARVIVENIRSLLAQDYPRELFRIFVIADNCTDDTAAVARTAGADEALERFDSELRGKGHALVWARDQVERQYQPDAYCVFDADNVASRNFLQVMNTRLAQGERIIQGYLDTKNPSDTWVTKAISAAYWISNRLWQLARSRLGLSNALGGTGYCVRRELLRQYEPDPTCLTDDLELQMRLLLEGFRVGWAHEAVTYDEKPLTLRQSWRQRVRWMQGHWDVARRYALPLFKRALLNHSLAQFDGALYCIQPALAVVGTLVGLALVLGACLLSQPQELAPPFSMPLHAWALLLCAYGVYPMLAMYLEGVRARLYLNYACSLLFAVTWLPITLLGMMKSRNKEWVHTEHTRSVSIEQVHAVDGDAVFSQTGPEAQPAQVTLSASRSSAP
ncbi:glycosyl transferase family 2 [Vitiosangium sp. GDMCC 1.1324]|nr:glycosyl transferase family 2 [Vitiosangium sp. GDMCC 1.1324]